MQIAEYICNRITSDQWQADGRIPSVRELGAELEVNPNTVMRAYEWLESSALIYNKRGIGFFVAPEAKSKITEQRRKEFLGEQSTQIVESLRLLDIPLDEFIAHLTKSYNSK